MNSPKKIFLAAGIAALVIVGGSGCSSAASPQAEEEFLSGLENSSYSDFETEAARTEAVKLAKGFCDILDTGLSPDAAVPSFLSLSTDFEFDIDSMGFIAGAGVPKFCPKYEDDMNF